jgi:inosose dehydratase
MSTLHIATNSFLYLQMAWKAKVDPATYWPQAMQMAKQSGLDGWEPGVTSAEELALHAKLAKEAGLEMRSVYVGVGNLHDADTAPTGVKLLIDCAREAKRHGVRLIVTNPDPISTRAGDAGGKALNDLDRAALKLGSAAAKNDEQLERQAKALGEAGRAMRAMGITLAYHWHEPEFAHGGREAHHMLLANAPEDLALYLDVHWTWRACGGSNVAVRNILTAYGPRIAGLHIRQSTAGIWNEVCQDGDVDYAPVAKAIAGRDVMLVLEQCQEEETKAVLGPVEAGRRSAEWVRRTFAATRSVAGARS